MTRIRWVVAIVSTIVVGLSVVLAVSIGNKHDVTTSTLTNHAAPQFSLVTFDGSTFNLSAQRGKVVFINYWNDWCEPCRAETNDLLRLQAQYASDPKVVMIGIVHDERSRKAVIDYANAVKMQYPLAFDPDAQTSLAYGVTGQPETFVVDPRGVIRKFVAGPIEPNEIVAMIDRLKA